MKYSKDIDNQAGFTILELMIATSVLSVLLLMATVIMISIGNLYYKGVNQASVQDNTRTILDDVAQHLKLGNNVVSASPISEGVPSVPVNAICIDSTRYTYVLGLRLYDNNFQHVLWRDTIVSGATCKPADLTVNDPSTTNYGKPGTGAELIADNSRLTDFTVNPVTSPYGVSVGIAFGDPNLSSSITGNNVRCLGQTGDQFCATSELSTIVDKRDFQ